MNVKQMLMNASEPIINPITKAVLKKHYNRSLELSEPGPYKRVVVFAPHMDDETIGAGGTIRRHLQEGAEVHCIFSTDGASSESELPKEELSRMRKEEMEKVNTILHMHSIRYMDLPDGQVESNAHSQGLLLELLKEIDPDLIYCTPFVDAHPDHVATGAILADTLQLWNKEDVTVRLYEINCPIPPDEINCVIDITSTYDTKKKAIDKFSSQVIAFDGFLALNRLKKNLVNDGAVKAAEAFIELSEDEFIKQYDALRQKNYAYHEIFKQANRTVTLLWAIYKNYPQKKQMYQERLLQ
ncbi:PIG-L deacetylase family protein [Pontibacillus salicampi]|uniref:PIG-L deacetylase family protein n=1 Tax=Pontibacillus salicampi TaxID=1449801 RepID=A0ABV6LSA1_9BACI